MPDGKNKNPDVLYADLVSDLLDYVGADKDPRVSFSRNGEGDIVGLLTISYPGEESDSLFQGDGPDSLTVVKKLAYDYGAYNNSMTEKKEATNVDGKESESVSRGKESGNGSPQQSNEGRPDLGGGKSPDRRDEGSPAGSRVRSEDPLDNQD